MSATAITATCRASRHLQLPQVRTAHVNARGPLLVALLRGVIDASPGAECRQLPGRSETGGWLMTGGLLNQPVGPVRAVVLLAHGSVDPRSPAAVKVLAELLAARTGRPVAPAFLDHVPPRLQDAVEQLVEQGFKDIAVLPLLLATAFHATVDVPEAIANAQQSDRGILQLDAIGYPAKVLMALLPKGSASTVVVAAGTSVRTEREAFMNVVHESAAATGKTAVGAFASGAGPTVAESVAALRQQSDVPINVLPWLVAPGIFTDRIAAQATAAAATYVPLPGGLIAQPVMIEELERRIRNATGPR